MKHLVLTSYALGVSLASRWGLGLAFVVQILSSNPVVRTYLHLHLRGRWRVCEMLEQRGYVRYFLQDGQAINHWWVLRII